MTALRIVIDGITEFEGELNEWQSRPPEFAKEMIKPNGVRPATHFLGIMVVLSNAVMQDEATHINVRTFHDGWTMTVKTL